LTWFPIHTRRSTLRLIDPSDYPELYELCVVENGGRWRLGGVLISPEAFPSALWDDVVLQGVIVASFDQAICGFVQIHQPNFVDGVASISAVTRDARRRWGVPVEGVLAMVDVAFDALGLRKLVATVSNDDPRFAASLERYCPCEAELPPCRGLPCGARIYAIEANRWDDELAPRVSAILRQT
jgi:RimJ/RimL family protein N-acetyltransferase